MILQELADYYYRISRDKDTDIAPAGFQKKEIPFLIILDSQGKFIGLQDTREGEGKKKRARSFTIPQAVKKTSGIASNLLWDNPAYVLGCPKPDPKKDKKKLWERAQKQQQCFIARIKETFPAPLSDVGLKAVLIFLEKKDFSPLFAHPLWPEIEESGADITFKIDGDRELVCQRQTVIDTVTREFFSEKGEKLPCLISGEPDVPVRLHTAIKGVWGAQTSGANIVSFNLSAFNSFGKTQSYNAPVGKEAEFAYTTALNTLLAKGLRQRIQVGDASTVFWANKSHPMESFFGELFSEPPKESTNQDNAAISALFSAPRTGAPPLDEDLTPFYVLGLAPNAARISIRFWYAGTVGEVTKNIRQYFDDCAIVHSPKLPDHLSIFRLLVSTAVQGKSDNIQPNLAGAMMQSILAGTLYPHTLLSSVIRRVKAEQEVTYPRAALIKAVLVREARFYHNTEKEVGMPLDRNNTNPGYLLGRLFAVLERAQESANPGINATIRDRFYGAASSTPVTVFPHLLKLKNHHIAKLENRGFAVNLEKRIGEIMDKIKMDKNEDGFPAHLDLPDQGRFAIGYYHQRQDFFTKKDNDHSSE